MNRAKRRWKALTVLIAASLAALTVTASLSATRTPEGAHRHDESYTFPDAYAGPVWVRVPDTDDVVEVSIAWGAWGAQWSIDPDDTRAYWFSKAAAGPEDNPPMSVTVTAVTDVEVGYGQLPIGARPTPPDAWYPLDGSAG